MLEAFSKWLDHLKKYEVEVLRRQDRIDAKTVSTVIEYVKLNGEERI
jgi:hypothetical protein